MLGILIDENAVLGRIDEDKTNKKSRKSVELATADRGKKAANARA